jgi:DDE_Tnp_1-associated
MSTGFENKKRKTKASFAPSIDSKDITTKFQEYFTEIKDPRVERTRYHLLTDIITIAILAAIAGAEGWEDIEEYGLNRLIRKSVMPTINKFGRFIDKFECLSQYTKK